METDIVQKSLLFNKDGNILLLRRSETDIRRPLQWDFPGGVLDAGETLEDGIVREIKEEANIDVESVHAFFAKTESDRWEVKDGPTSQKNILRIYYAAHSETDDVALSFEHSEYCWVSLDAAYDLLEYHRHKEVIKWAIDNKLAL